jgi:hypothetical protein
MLGAVSIEVRVAGQDCVTRRLQAGALGLLALLAIVALRAGSTAFEHHHAAPDGTVSHSHVHAGPHRHLFAASHGHAHERPEEAPCPSPERPTDSGAPSGAYVPPAPSVADGVPRVPAPEAAPCTARSLRPTGLERAADAPRDRAAPPRAPPR